MVIGKDPGTTRRIEIHKLAPGLGLVDMPGYGRSIRGGRDAEDQIKDQILSFLKENAANIILVVHVVNTGTFIETMGRLDKKGFIPVDVEMVHYVKRDLGIPVLVAANKVDKAGVTEMGENLDALKEELGPSIPVYPVSARTDYGIPALKDEIRRRLVDAGFQSPFESLR